MTDESKRKLFLCGCKACKEKVAIMASLCPHCGAKNPSVKWQHSLLVWGLLLTALFVFFHDEKTKTRKAESTVTAPATVEATAPAASLEELQAVYDKAQERANIIRVLSALVDEEVAVPNQTKITQYLLDGKEKAKSFGYALFQEQIPNTDKDLAELYKEMNQDLGVAAGAIADRIDYAIELSSGTKNPVKAAQKFSAAKGTYETGMALFEQAAHAVAQRLMDMQIKETAQEQTKPEPEEQEDSSTPIDEATFPGKWPFTVSSGTISCVPPSTILFKADKGSTYAVNGQAGAMFKQLPDLEEIWKPNPRHPALKIDIGDVIDYGLSLCEK